MPENCRLFIVLKQELYLDPQGITANYIGTSAHCGRQKLTTQNIFFFINISHSRKHRSYKHIKKICLAAFQENREQQKLKHNRTIRLQDSTISISSSLLPFPLSPQHPPPSTEEHQNYPSGAHCPPHRRQKSYGSQTSATQQQLRQ
jgi:hypothetical protein